MATPLALPTQSLHTREEADSHITVNLPFQEPTNPETTEPARLYQETTAPMLVKPNDFITEKAVLEKLELFSDKLISVTSEDGYEKFGKYISLVLRGLHSLTAQSVMEKIFSDVLSARQGSKGQAQNTDPQSSANPNLKFQVVKVPEPLCNEIPNIIDVSSPSTAYPLTETRQSVLSNDDKERSQLDLTDSSSSLSKIPETSQKKLGKRRQHSELDTQKVRTQTSIRGLNSVEIDSILKNTEQDCSEPNATGATSKRGNRKREISPPNNDDEKFDGNQTLKKRKYFGSQCMPPMKKKKSILAKDNKHTSQLCKEEVLILPKASSTQTSQCDDSVGNQNINCKIQNLEPVHSTSSASIPNESVQSRKKEFKPIPSTSQKNMFSIQNQEVLSVESKSEKFSGTTQVSQNKRSDSQTSQGHSMNKIDGINVCTSTVDKDGGQSIEDPPSPESESDDPYNIDLPPPKKKYKRGSWSSGEKLAIYKRFYCYIMMDLKPTRDDVRKIWEEEESLQNRSVPQVETYVNRLRTGKEKIPDEIWNLLSEAWIHFLIKDNIRLGII